MRSALAVCLLIASIAMPHLAHAGMGNRNTTPVYHPEPCQGDACKADDPRSGLPCQGLLCSFSSAKALQPPLTAAQAAEVQQRAAVETVKPIEMAPPAVKAASTKKKRIKRVAKSDAASEGAAPAPNRTSTTTR